MKFKKLIAPMAAAGILAALISVTPAQEAGTVYGDPGGEAPTVPIPQLVAAPEQYVGHTVQVSGRVTEVCPQPGCSIKLATPDDAETTIDIQFDDEGIAFPPEIMGHDAVVEGVMTKIVLTMEQTIAYLQHEAEVQGLEFDVESVTEPLTRYELKGTGAVIF